MIKLDNPVLKTIRERRSIIRFKPTKVEEDKIEQILESGRWAPSYLNKQPWEFIVVNDPKKKQLLGDTAIKVTLFSEGITQASAVVVVVVDPEKDPYHYIEDGSIAAQNMVLAAHSLGLATYWIGIFDLQQKRRTAEEAVKEILSIPKKYRVIAILPIGEPAYEEHSNRKKLSEIVHRNEYQAI